MATGRVGASSAKLHDVHEEALSVASALREEEARRKESGVSVTGGTVFARREAARSRRPSSANRPDAFEPDGGGGGAVPPSGHAGVRNRQWPPPRKHAEEEGKKKEEEEEDESKSERRRDARPVHKRTPSGNVHKRYPPMAPPAATKPPTKAPGRINLPLSTAAPSSFSFASPLAAARAKPASMVLAKAQPRQQGRPRPLVGGGGGKGVHATAIEDLLRQQERALRLALELSRPGGVGQWGNSDEDTDDDGELYDVFSEGDDSEGAEDDEEEGAWDSQDGYAVLLLLEHAQTQRTLASLLYRTRLRCRHSASLEAALLLSDALRAFSRCAAAWEVAVARHGLHGAPDPDGNLAFEIAATANSLALLLQTSPGVAGALRDMPTTPRPPPPTPGPALADLQGRGSRNSSRRHRRQQRRYRQQLFEHMAGGEGGGAPPDHGWDPGALYALAEERLIQLKKGGCPLPQLWSFVLCSHAWLLQTKNVAGSSSALEAEAALEAKQLYGHALAADPLVVAGDKLADHYCEELGVLYEAELARQSVELLRAHASTVAEADETEEQQQDAAAAAADDDASVQVQGAHKE